MRAHRQEYERRINDVIDYISAHRGEDLRLDRLAAIAAFSPFHFHRVFKAVTGETIADFVQRLRLERAARALRDVATFEGELMACLEERLATAGVI